MGEPAMSGTTGAATQSRPPAVRVMRNLGLEPDPWQVEVLEGGHRRLLLNCCRQAGKSTAVALLGLTEAVFVPGTKVLLVSRSGRQSAELFRRVADFHRRMGAPLLERRTATELELANFSRVVSLPCREDTIRGYDNVGLLVIDEAARVPDDARCVVAGPAPTEGRAVGGLDFGFRNPFAAVWGVVDGDGVLWLTGEHYARQKPLSHHARFLPRAVMWYADPSGATERAELR